MPHSGLPAVGSFSEWERKVRDLVWWLTGYDLSEEFDKNKKDDPEQQNDAALLAALRDYFGEKWFKASEADAAMKRATEHRRYGGFGTANVAENPGAQVAAAPEQTDTQAVNEIIQAVNEGAANVAALLAPNVGARSADPKVLDKKRARLEQAVHAAREDAILEAAEQKFGSKQDYAKTLGNWARGLQNKFIDGFILCRQEDTHTKIQRLKVTLAKLTNEE
jgi:hypothetical protein